MKIWCSWVKFSSSSSGREGRMGSMGSVAETSEVRMFGRVGERFWGLGVERLRSRGEGECDRAPEWKDVLRRGFGKG